MAAGKVKDEGLEGAIVHAAKKLGYNIKDLQFDVQKVVTGHDVFAVAITNWFWPLSEQDTMSPLLFINSFQWHRTRSCNLSSCPL